MKTGSVVFDGTALGGASAIGGSGGLWRVDLMSSMPDLRGPAGAQWFNDREWSGVETPRWLAWVGNRSRLALVWANSDEVMRREALSVVLPAALRREGLLDGHGAVIAPDPDRPEDGLFITGLSGSGKSSLTVSCALGGARFVSDDSVALELQGETIQAWRRRSALSLSPAMHRTLIPKAEGRLVEDKVILDAHETFPNLSAESIRVRALVFLDRPGPAQAGSPGGAKRTALGPLSAAEAFRRLLMGHPILALDRGARHCFPVVKRLTTLPAYTLTGGEDILDPHQACRTLAALLPGGSHP